MDTQLEKLFGFIQHLIFDKGKNDFAVFELMTTDKEVIVCTGNVYNPKEGDQLELDGSFVKHPVHDWQFSFSNVKVMLPDSGEGIIKWLSSHLKGVGRAKAEKLFNTFGTDVYASLNDESAIDNILGSKIAASIVEQYVDLFAEGKIELVQLLTENKLGRYIDRVWKAWGEAAIDRLKDNVWKAWGEAAMDRLKDNPYDLIQFKGIGFKIADELALKLGMDKEDSKRLTAAVVFILKEIASRNGCTWITSGDFNKKVYENLDMYKHVDFWIDFVNSMDNVWTDGDRIAYVYYRFLARQVAKKLTILNQIDVFNTSFTVDISDLNELQRVIIEKALKHRFLVITGNPGTGKTHTARKIIKYFPNDEDMTVLCAPTGKAAKRLEELTGRTAYTIHRLLGFRGNGIYEYGPDLHLPHKFVIVDEASMLTLEVFYQLLSALDDDARLILIGDIDQLPPIGAGSPLRDIIDSGLFTIVKLTEIVRQKADSSIIQNAHKIVRGEMPIIDPDKPDFVFIECDSYEEIADVVIREMVRLLEMPEYSIKDIQIITPQHKKVVGRENLNTRSRDVANPIRLYKDMKFPFQVGDKVIQTVNNYTLDVFNGDCGMVTSILDVEHEEDRCIGVKWNDGATTNYPKDCWSELDYAFAITVHKSQGSEFKNVIMPVCMEHRYMLERSLLYTGITRAEDNVILVGDKDAMRIAINNVKLKYRNTWLKEFLLEKY